MPSENESVEMSMTILDLSNDILNLTQSIDSITMEYDDSPNIENGNVDDPSETNNDILSSCLDSFQVLELKHTEKKFLDTPSNLNVETMTASRQQNRKHSDIYMSAAIKRYNKDRKKQNVPIIPLSVYQNLSKSKENVVTPSIQPKPKDDISNKPKDVSKSSSSQHNFYKFKYWKCKLCDREGIPFEEMHCPTCGRSKKFKPIHERDYSSSTVSRKIHPQREEAKFLKQEKEEVSISERLERQYLYGKHDFEVDTRQKLVKEVDELLSSIRDWL
jgi:hypothetical protein